ncbi:MAG: sigma-70 family RNA polymerase sigma factor [Frankiaceae bacterium]|nr:sigma-70 family RNA polymerase sigma factor [Frankiaceae bacterium]
MPDQTPTQRSGAEQAPVEEDLDAALRAARAGEEGGFLVLWRTHQPMLLRFLRVYGADGPEDVAGDTWLQVVRDLPRFEGDADGFRRWLFTIARHRAIDAGRSRARRPVALVGDVTSLDGARSAASAEEQVMDRMSTDDALAALRNLPPAQAELVALRVLADLDVATVAGIVGMSPGAVRVAVHRALRTLSNQPSLTAVEVT